MELNGETISNISKRVEKTKKYIYIYLNEKCWLQSEKKSKGKRTSGEAEWIFSLGNVGTIVYLPTGGRERRLVRGDGRRARRVLLTRDRRQ